MPVLVLRFSFPHDEKSYIRLRDLGKKRIFFQMIQNELKSEHSLFKEVTVFIFTRTESPTVTAVSAGGSLITQKADTPGNSLV